MDLGAALVLRSTDELIETLYSDDRDRRYFKDKAFRGRLSMDRAAISGQGNFDGFAHARRQQWLVTVDGDTEPGETYLFDRKTRKLTPQYKVREKLPRESLAAMQAVRYKSSDGLEIPAYLTLAQRASSRRICRRWCCRTAGLGRAMNGATTRWRNSSPTAAMPS